MEKILAKISHKEMGSLCSDIILIKLNPNLEKDTYFMSKLADIKKKFDVLIDKTNEEWRTRKVRSFDKVRDTDLKAIFYLVEAYCMRRDDSKKRSALNLKKTLDKYGLQILKKRYVEKSSLTNSLLVQIKDKKHQNDRDQIPELDELIVNLEQSQKDYYKAVEIQIEEIHNRKNSKPAYIISMELRKLINEDFAPYIYALSLARKEAYLDYSNSLSSIIKTYNKKVRFHLNHLKRKKHAELIKN